MKTDPASRRGVALVLGVVAALSCGTAYLAMAAVAEMLLP